MMVAILALLLATVLVSFMVQKIKRLVWCQANFKKLGSSSCGLHNRRKRLPYENPNEGILYHIRKGALLPSGEELAPIWIYISTCSNKFEPKLGARVISYKI